MNPMTQPMRWLSLGVLGLLAAGADAQTVIPSASRLPSSAADTSQPGFIWRVHQVASSQPTTLARTEAQLAGLLGDNIADPNAIGIAEDVAEPPDPPTAPIEFVIPTVINVEQGAGSSGNFTPDDQMPGIPGTTFSTDNIAAEVLTWLDLPAGEIVMGVNSDDGFRVQIGGANPKDPFGVNVGEFNAGRGASDSIFRFTISEAGLYAARLIYNEGGSGASLEWFTQTADGTKVLINDVANGGIPAYRAVSAGASIASLTRISPGIGQAGVVPNAPIQLELTDGATPIDPASISITLDGTPLSVTPAKTGSVTAVSFTPTQNYAPASTHEIAFTYTEGGTPKTLTWSFTVANYKTLPASARVTPVTGEPGFIWTVFANALNQATTNQRAEEALAGLLNDEEGNPLPNNADPAAVGVAAGAASAPNPENAPIQFEIPGVINLTQAADDDADNQNGSFTPDQQMPGIPAFDGTDGIAAEILTYLELPAGVITMGVNSDDGFRTTSGNARDVFSSILLGEFDGGRGAADTRFHFVVEEAGVYPFRTLWQEGGGGANIEWFTVNADGTKVLVNDTANGGVRAYRAIEGDIAPYVQLASPPLVPRQVNQPSTVLTLVLTDGTQAVDDDSIALEVDGAPVTITKERRGDSVLVRYTPQTLFIPDELHSAELTFATEGGGTPRTQTWEFRNLKNIALPDPVLTENFDSYEEGTVPTGWVATNFTTTATEGEDLDNLSSDSYKGWIVVSRDRLETLKSRIFNVAPGQFVNGEEVTTLSEGNLLYLESDVRGGDQVAFITSRAFDLSNVTNVVLSFSSLYEQNQDNIGAVEYSVDGGANWLPVVYFIDVADAGGDIRLNPDGSVDAIATLTGPNLDTAAWVENGVAKGDKYGDALLAPITQELGNYIAPRINDNPTIDKRVEVFRLPQAGGKSDVRLRFAYLGTGSWYFGVDNIAFYEGPPPPAGGPSGDGPTFEVATLQNGQVRIAWTGAGTLETAESVTGPWTPAADQTNPQLVSPMGAARFFRIRQ